MTNQTEDFRDYITVTQKMRAYKGKIEPGSPLAVAAEAAAAATAAAAAAPPPPKPEVRLPNPDVARPRSVPSGMVTQKTRIGSGGTSMLAIGTIVVLFVLAVALAIALVLK